MLATATARITPRWRIALLAPFALSTLLCLIAKPEPASLVATLLGPWAGFVYGHHDCTMGSQLPLASFGSAALGLALAAAQVFVPPPDHRRTLNALSLVWALAWCALALLSMVNTLA